MILLSELIEHRLHENHVGEKLFSLRELKNISIDETKSQISSKSDYF